jgi:hypothetical protein
LILSALIALFFFGLFHQNAVSSKTLISLTIGAVDPRAFIYRWAVPSAGSKGLISNVLIANSPQAIFSTIYYTYNGLFTCFLLGAEWNSYASERKGLRISSGSQGSQRTTYFLQLPYRWALPLMVLSGTLHWLCSQSLFLVSVQFDQTAIHGPLDTEYRFVEFLTCGYSPSAILSTVLIGSAMVIFAVMIGRRKHVQGGIPIAGSCSASISACCHSTLQPDDSWEDSALLPLQWGETVTQSPVPGVDEGNKLPQASAHSEDERTWHCSFSSQEVEKPREGAVYAGIRERTIRQAALS